MSIRSFNQGILSIQNGQHDEGERMLNIALKSGELNPQQQAEAYMWLASIKKDRQTQIEYYEKALLADPHNADAQQRLKVLRQMPQPPANNMPTWDTNTPSQGIPNPTQQPGWQNTPPQGMPNPTQQPGWQNTPPQGMPNPTQQPGWQNTPSQGMPNQQGGWQHTSQQNTTNQQGGWAQNMPNQQGGWQNTPPQGMPNPTQQPGWQNTPPQGMPNPTQQPGWQNTPPPSMPTNNAAFDPRMRPTRQPQPTPTAPQPPIMIEDIQRTVHIIGHRGSSGTGFFIMPNGIIATTRRAIAAEYHVTVELANGRRIEGKVVKSYPAYDLALIQIKAHIAKLAPITDSYDIAENTSLLVLHHPDNATRTSRRATQHITPPHWFPTMIKQHDNAGGNPLYDEQTGRLVGMLTGNIRRTTGYLHGLSIHKIYECYEQYHHQKQQTPDMIYCHHCGNGSMARQAGGYYCETCGALMDYAVELNVTPQYHLAPLYGENTQRPCPNCTATVGYYNGTCLRCGHKTTRRKPRIHRG